MGFGEAAVGSLGLQYMGDRLGMCHQRLGHRVHGCTAGRTDTTSSMCRWDSSGPVVIPPTEGRATAPVVAQAFLEVQKFHHTLLICLFF